MGKHILILLVISLVGIIWIKEITEILNYLMHSYVYLSKLFSRFIVGGYVIAIIRQSVIFMMIPIGITAIPAGLYWIVKRRLMPYFYETIYAFWFLMIASLAFYK